MSKRQTEHVMFESSRLRKRTWRMRMHSPCLRLRETRGFEKVARYFARNIDNLYCPRRERKIPLVAVTQSFSFHTELLYC
ncbi:MAG: hypothetical protein ACI92I_000316 [Acidimicrobiales bacterium]|jgi:hypothetical protein